MRTVLADTISKKKEREKEIQHSFYYLKVFGFYCLINKIFLYVIYMRALKCHFSRENNL